MVLFETIEIVPIGAMLFTGVAQGFGQRRFLVDADVEEHRRHFECDGFFCA